MWERRYGGPEDDHARAVAATSDGGFVVVGFTRGNRPSGDDAWVLRLRGDGELQWEKTFGGDESDSAFHVAVSRDDTITVAGNSRSSDSDGYDAWIFRLTADGALLWQRHFDHGLFDAATAVTTLGDEGVLVIGITSTKGFDREDSWAVRLDSRGEVQWRHSFEGLRRDTGWSAHVTSDGGFVIALATSSRGSGSTDAIPVRLDRGGDRLWERVYGGTLWDRPAALAVLRDASIALGGYTTTSGAGYEDFWILHLDRDGLL